MTTPERHHVGEQWVDIVDGEDLGGGDDNRADQRAEQAVEATDQRRRTP
jgi:hypothetical protein